jgi:hypothetical protein
MSQYLVCPVTLADKHVEQRRELGRFVDTFNQSGDRSFPRIVRASACSGRMMTGFAQLNLPQARPWSEAFVALNAGQGNRFRSPAALAWRSPATPQGQAPSPAAHDLSKQPSGSSNLSGSDPVDVRFRPCQKPSAAPPSRRRGPEAPTRVNGGSGDPIDNS